MDNGKLSLFEVLRPGIPMRIIMALLKGDMYREQLFRETGTPTGYLAKYLTILIDESLVAKYPQGRKITMYTLTPRGKLVGFSLMALCQIPDLNDEHIVCEIEKRHHVFLAYMSRVSRGELFDQDVAKSLDDTLSFAGRLNVLVRSIVPRRIFTLDELHKEHNKLFPKDRKRVEAFSTCLSRFRNEKRREHVPGLKMIRSGTYLMEPEGNIQRESKVQYDIVNAQIGSPLADVVQV